MQELAGPNRAQDDPELIQFIKDEIIEERRPFVPKMSHLLYQTPQAKVIDKMFNKKVSISPHWITNLLVIMIACAAQRFLC